MFQDDKSISPLILALMAALTGIFLGVPVWALAAILDWTRPVAWGIGAWAISSALSWLMLLQRWWAILEAVLDVDLNRDGMIGYPDPTPDRLRLDIIDQDPAGYIAGDYLDLDIDRQRMIDVAMILERGGRFGYASLAGPGKPLSRSEFEALRDLMIQAGMVRWVNERAHNQGLKLTGKGGAVVRGFASMAATPIPQLREVIEESD